MYNSGRREDDKSYYKSLKESLRLGDGGSFYYVSYLGKHALYNIETTDKRRLPSVNNNSINCDGNK